MQTRIIGKVCIKPISHPTISTSPAKNFDEVTVAKFFGRKMGEKRALISLTTRAIFSSRLLQSSTNFPEIFRKVPKIFTIYVITTYIINRFCMIVCRLLR